MGLWLKQEDGTLIPVSGDGGGDGSGGGPHLHPESLPVSGGTVTGNLTVEGQITGLSGYNKPSTVLIADSVATRYAMQFQNADGVAGRIVTVDSETRYETSAVSSRAEIPNATDIPDAIETLKALSFQRSIDGDGVFGEEAHAVYPFAVSAGSDPENPEYAVDYGRFTPLLGAVVQELLGQVEQLSLRLQEIEGN